MANQKLDLALAFLQSQPESAAGILEQHPAEEVAIFLKQVPGPPAALVLEKLLPQYTARLCNNLEPADAASLLAAMDLSLVAAILRHSGKDPCNQLLRLLPEKTRIACKLLLNYSEDAVGAWMITHISTVPHDVTVQDALNRLSREPDAVHLETVPVVDRERQLMGIVALTVLLRSGTQTPITEVMEKDPQAVSGRTALNSAKKHPVWAHKDSIPVINRNDQLLGILRHLDLRKGLDQIATTINQPSGHGAVTGICEVYGKSLLAIFDAVGEMAGAKPQFGAGK